MLLHRNVRGADLGFGRRHGRRGRREARMIIEFQYTLHWCMCRIIALFYKIFVRAAFAADPKKAL